MEEHQADGCGMLAALSIGFVYDSPEEA